MTENEILAGNFVLIIPGLHLYFQSINRFYFKQHGHKN